MNSISRETAIALAKEAGFKASIGQTSDDKYHPDRNAIGKSVPIEWVQRFYDLAVAYSRKDAEPVAICAVTPQGELSVGWRAGYKPQHNEKLFTHPPEADKLLQDLINFDEGPLHLQTVAGFDKHLNAIRTYLEGK